MRVQNRAERDKEVAKFERELRSIRAKLIDKAELADILGGDDKKAAANGAKAISDALVSLVAPAVQKLQMAAERIEHTQSNLHRTFALAAYQREQGRYPRTLDALAPKYLKKIP